MDWSPQVGEYILQFKEDEILDDYRNANYKVLRFPNIVNYTDNEGTQIKHDLFVAQDF